MPLKPAVSTDSWMRGANWVSSSRIRSKFDSRVGHSSWPCDPSSANQWTSTAIERAVFGQNVMNGMPVAEGGVIRFG